MLDHSRIDDRFSEIRKRLRLLRETAASTDEVTFLTESIIADATERRIQVAIQACMDIANHIVAQIALEKPQKENKEVFKILADHDIIDKELAQKLIKMAGMRNVLVHDYREVERGKIYHTIKHDLGDIEEFVSQIQKFIDKTK